MTQYYTMTIKDGAMIFTPAAFDNPPASRTLIDVPYLSQLGPTAAYAPGDCGAACLAMLINWQGGSVTVDEVSKATGQAPGYKFLSFDAMIRTADRFGLTLKHTFGYLDDDIDGEIQAGKPLIALVNYQSIPPTLRREMLYNAGHWIVVVGSDVANIVYHDPDWLDASSGANKRIAAADFMKAFQTVAPGNTLASHALVIR